jgi:uncharacterized protein
VVDSHAGPVGANVWNYLSWVLRRCEPHGIVLEWDQDFPPFGVILDELAKARTLLDRSRSVSPDAASRAVGSQIEARSSWKTGS